MTATVREATPEDADDVERLLDAAMLEFDRERVRRRIAAGNALVAVAGTGESGADGDGGTDAARVVGVCVFGDGDRAAGVVGDGDRAAGVVGDGDRAAGVAASVDAGSDPDAPATEIEQIAVHRSRRGRGIGRGLVAAVDERADGPLFARFHESVRPFYEALGFEIADGRGPDERLLGVLR